MFPGGSGSQDSFSPRTLSTTPVSSCPSNLEIVSPQADIAETLSFLPGIPSPNPEWPAHSAFVVQDSALPAQRFGLSLSPQHSVSALNPPRQLDTVLNSEYPLANPIGHPSLEDTIHIKQEYTSQNPRGLGISSYPMSVASDVYLAGAMQQNSPPYGWANRPYHPLQPPSEHMSPPFPSSTQSYPAPGYAMGYSDQPPRQLHGYHHQEPQISPTYIASPRHLDHHSQSQNPHFIRPIHHQPISGPPPLPEQPLMTSPSTYMMNQPGYYFHQGPAVHTRPHPASVNPRPPSMAAPEPIYSSPESASAHITETDQPARHANSRPRPQCWDHGCNGREFSTFSNLLRHQRERSGVVAKAECPVCGAVFTRTTARNIHVAQGKCRTEGRESSTE